MATRYRIIYQENADAPAIEVCLCTSSEESQAVINSFEILNPGELHLYRYEPFEDPSYVPPSPIVFEFAPQPITQESLDTRLAQTTPDNLNPTSVAEYRIAICNPCEFNKPLMGFGKCSECNCFVYLKTRIKSSVCPKGKW